MPKKILYISEALMNPKRRLIVRYLMERPGTSLRSLAKELNIGVGALYNHLMILSRVGLINMSKERGRVLIHINEELLINKRVSEV
ncbi:MAG: hypothetical protein DRJ52_08030 [Thermoprotei archaeon]|nr:MAG: hypothetical protein DRJ52_08030 [Thermoprotei archaeon]RLF00598.1 MAG: hypothetical protein DRJ63_02150 [Thermoprotei archaeon]